MRFLLVLFAFALPMSAQAFSYATGGCATGGCAATEQWEPTNANEIANAMTAVEGDVATNTADIVTINSNLANYLPLAGGTITGVITVSAPGEIVLTGGAAISADGSSDILATSMSATGQIDDNDLAAGAVDGGTGGEIADGTITAADLATDSVTGADILNDTVVLITDTAGDFIATLTGDSEITVSGSGTEGRAVTLAIASSLTRDTELDAKSAATSTSGNIPKFSGTGGDLVDTGVAIDGSNNVTIPGNITAGTSGYSCFFFRDKDDAGDTECTFLNGVMSCRTDAGTIGACDGP